MWRQYLKIRTTTLAKPERRMFSQTFYTERGSADPNSLMDSQITCLMLHPVTWPNHGPQKELYLAEEAIGLVRSLDWQVAKGPLWQEQEKEEEQRDKVQLRQALEGAGEETGGNQTTEMISTEEAPGGDDQYRKTFSQRRLGMRFSHKKNYVQFKNEKIRDGDYVYGPDLQGVYYKKGGIILEMDTDENDAEYDLYDEWKNELIRESVAKSSLIKVRKIHSSTFFTKGKLNDIGYFLKDNKNVNVVFINSTMTSLQQKKLEKRWNDIILSREDRLRKYYLKSAQKEKFNPTDIDSESSQMSELETPAHQGPAARKIRVIDRFGIILQIFALRAKTRAAQLQLELAWLKYARTMLVRGGAPTFGQIGNIFQGNMMRLDMQEVGIKSAKGRKSGSGGTIGGEGETQLEIERRKLTDREAKITKELEQLRLKIDHEKFKKEQSHQTLPLIALIGYTNAGKTALMNLCTGANLESKDLLFQTLNTTHKRFHLPNGQLGLMLDTVGFITNLPHGLVESFKATLEEIHHADLVVHVRDISHPQTNYQRDTVLRVLREIGVPDEIFDQKYIEVWNKIDLLEDQEGFVENLKQELTMTSPNYPVVMMSCKNGTNKELFLNEIQAVSSVIMGKQLIPLKYKYSQHQKVLKWLLEHAGITIQSGDNMEYDDEGNITLRVPIDEITHQKYMKQFEPEKFEDERSNQRRFPRGSKLAPPPGW